MRKTRVAIVALALVVLVAGAAQAEMYVEAYLGGNFAGSASDEITGSATTMAGVSTPWTFDPAGNIDPAFQGGLKIGTWFVKEGFLGMNYPDWMKYLGFYLDFSYHRVDFRREKGTWTNLGGVPFSDNFFSEGNAFTLAFMFAARYGFLPDSEVPFGRLQPYVAVGPAILFTSQQPSFYNVPPMAAWALKCPSQSSTNVALAVEAGVRWMALKNVSIDASFKYRYSQPSYSYSGVWDGNRVPIVYSFTLDPTYNFFSVQLGAAYHF